MVALQSDSNPSFIQQGLLYILCCFLAQWRLWAGTVLPVAAFFGYYNAYSALSDALSRHGGGGDVQVTVMPDNIDMIWTFILSAGIQIGLFVYARNVSRDGPVCFAKKPRWSILALATSIWAVSEAGLLLGGSGSMVRLSIAAILSAGLQVGLFVYGEIVSLTTPRQK